MASIITTQSVNLSLADLNDILVYTIVLKNTGTSLANNIILTNVEPEGAIFLKGSFEIEGISKSNIDPTISYNLGSLVPGNSITVKFSMEVIGIPTSNTISNSAVIEYEYENSIEELTTNLVSTDIKNATINFNMSVNKNIVPLEETKTHGIITYNASITYTVVLKNEGNVDATNLILTNPLPDNNMTFRAGSVQIDSVTESSASPITGIRIATIAPNISTTISYTVDLGFIPIKNPIENRATLSYDYTSIIPISRLINSNFVITQVNYAHISLSVKCDRHITPVESIMSYRTDIINDGNISVTNSKCNFANQNGEYIRGTFTINNVRKNVSQVWQDFNIGTIEPGERVVIRFSASVYMSSLTIGKYTTNLCNFNGDFLLVPDGGPENKRYYSNIATTIVEDDNISPFKVINKTVAQPGDDITYNICFGGINEHGSLGLKENIPPELTQIGKESVSLNPIAEGIPLNLNDTPNIWGRVFTVNTKFDKYPPFHKNIIYNSANILATYFGEGGGDTPPERRLGTEIVATYVPRSEITLDKILVNPYVSIGDIITCCTVVTNSGDLVANNVKITEKLPYSFKFIPKTVTVNSVVNTTGNPKTGINVGNVNVGESIFITFKVQVNPFSISNQFSIVSEAIASFTLLDGNESNNKTFISNSITMQVLDVRINAIQSVDKTMATLGDTLTYNIKLSNVGNVGLKKVFFNNQIPEGITFLQDSVTINSVADTTLNPNIGFEVGNIPIGGKTEISFKATVDEVLNTIIIKNQGNINFQYLKNPSSNPVMENTPTTIALTLIKK